MNPNTQVRSKLTASIMVATLHHAGLPASRRHLHGKQAVGSESVSSSLSPRLSCFRLSPVGFLTYRNTLEPR